MPDRSMNNVEKKVANLLANRWHKHWKFLEDIASQEIRESILGDVFALSDAGLLKDNGVAGKKRLDPRF